MRQLKSFLIAAKHPNPAVTYTWGGQAKDYLEASGAVGLQTLLPAALRLVHAGHLTLAQLFRALSLNPAKRLGLPQGRLAPGAPADLVLFDPSAPFVLDRFKLLSKAKNTPFDGARMEGKVIGTWVAGNRVFGA